MRISLTALHKMAQDGDKITMLTCYDASFAALLDAAGVDTLLIGDSLGMVLQGHDSTLPVTMRDVAYHTACVARGAKRAFIIADMPFGTFQVSPAQAFANAAQLMAAGAQMVKLEGGEPMAETIAFLTARGVPVCGHLGLTPQSVHQLGGYRVQGKNRIPGAAADCGGENAGGCGRRHAGARVDSGRAGARGYAASCACRPSASAPASTARGRCWCCTTCSMFSRQESEVREELPARRRQHPGRDRGVRQGSQGQDVSRA